MAKKKSDKPKKRVLSKEEKEAIKKNRAAIISLHEEIIEGFSDTYPPETAAALERGGKAYLADFRLGKA